MKFEIWHTISPWISINPTPDRKGRLFCLPFAGGGAIAYLRWPGLILPGIEVARVHLPGRETRLKEPLFKQLLALVDILVEEVYRCLNGPFVLFGHSLGALMAFELARALRRRHNLLPEHLFVSGFWAPHLSPLETPFSHLPDEEFITRVIQYGGVPDLVVQNEELLEIFLPILRADFAMIETYVYRVESPLECSISAFGGFNDPKISYGNITAWELHTSGRFNTHLFLGGHFFINDSQGSVLNEINRQLNEALYRHTEYEINKTV